MSNTKIRPLQDRIIVKRLDSEEKTASGLYIPDSAKDKPQQGKVIAVGKGKVKEDGSVLPVEVKKGDKILFGQVKQVVDECFLEVECINEIGKLVKYTINPNSDYNFGFILNAEAESKYAAALNRLADESDL